MAQSTARRERMHVRLDEKTKRKLVRAARYQDVSVSEFVLSNAVAAAERVLDVHESVKLAPADWDAFYDALVRPPRAHKKLAEAVRWYRSLGA
jgi:uncharacterized protein (DUF1778 family)